MAILGIEFEPLNTSLKTRLETIATAAYVIVFVFGVPFGFFLAGYLILYTQYWWLCIFYLSWAWIIDSEASEKEDSGRNEWVRGWTWYQYVSNYFPIKLVKLPSVELDPKRNYLFACFPHGFISTGAFLTFATNAVGFKDAFPSHRPHCCTLPLQFYAPFLRWLGFAWGTRSCSAKSMNYMLSKQEGGHVVALVVGGAAESYYCNPGEYKLVLKNRKGFVKIALLNGSPLVPVITFGETEIYSMLQGKTLKMVQEWIRKIIGFAPVIPAGRGIFQRSFGLLPHKRPLNVVVGKVMDVQKTENPTQEQIDELHKLFVEQLVETFESEKKKYIEDCENVHLEIV